MVQTFDLGAGRSEHHDSFYMSLRPLFLLGQFTGVLPLLGTCGNSHKCLRFSWSNPQFFYIGVLLSTTAFFDFTSTVDNIQDGIRLDNFGPTVFYSSCILNILFFVEVAQNLPYLCTQVASYERTLGQHPPSMGLHIKLILATFLIIATVEHSLVTYLGVLDGISASELKQKPFLESFFLERFQVFMNNIRYSNTVAIFLFTVNVICTLNWNYLDFFIICVCIEISAKFRLINNRIRHYGSQKQSTTFWRKVRTDYNDLSVLTKTFDSLISKLVFASYTSNLYHLSLQLLRSLRFKGDVYAMTYFYFSLAYLLMRTVIVSLSAASIAEESKYPKDLLYCIKNPCAEVERLLEQVILDDVTITGKKFFSVNRRFILTVFATVITYEIILLQFNSLKDSS